MGSIFSIAKQKQSFFIKNCHSHFPAFFILSRVYWRYNMQDVSTFFLPNVQYMYMKYIVFETIIFLEASSSFSFGDVFQYLNSHKACVHVLKKLLLYIHTDIVHSTKSLSNNFQTLLTQNLHVNYNMKWKWAY